MLKVVVLGMHKSGTSLVSELLHHSGIEMIEADRAAIYDEGQHYERPETREINKQLLNSWRLHSLETVEPLRDAGADRAAKAKAQDLVTSLEKKGQDWGFKDPRTCLTYGFWTQFLPDHKLICIFRDALEVSEHYRRRNRRRLDALHAWYVYNSAMLTAYEGAPDHARILIDHDSLMGSNTELERLSGLVGRPIADRRDHRLRRSRAAGRWRWEALKLIYRLKTGSSIGELNRRLKQLAAGPST